jgi:hypothetical protein
LPSVRRGTQPVELFGRIERRTRTQTPLAVRLPSIACTRFVVFSGVRSRSRVTGAADLLGALLAITLRMTNAQRYVAVAPLESANRVAFFDTTWTSTRRVRGGTV